MSSEPMKRVRAGLYRTTDGWTVEYRTERGEWFITWPGDFHPGATAPTLREAREVIAYMKREMARAASKVSA